MQFFLRTPDFKSKRALSKNNRRANCISYVTLVTYVPVLGAEQFQLPCRVISDGFSSEDEQTGSNLYLLSQTFNQKGKFVLWISSVLYRTFLISLIWWWLPHWRTHGGSYVFEVVVTKIQYNNLENLHNCFLSYYYSAGYFILFVMKMFIEKKVL